MLPRISGEIGNRNNCRHARAAGRSLAELHQALNGFALQSHLPAWGHIAQIHPSIADPLAVPEYLMLDSGLRSRLTKIIVTVMEAVPQLYQTLPLQTIHGDYLSFNILLQENQLVGVLDFEFATKDMRLVDYICGLDDWAIFPWKDESRWEFVRAFAEGYGEHLRLTRAEVELMLTAWRLQKVSSIVYWTGWLREGKLTRQKVVDAVTDTLLFDDWLADNWNKLLSYIKWT